MTDPDVTDRVDALAGPVLNEDCVPRISPDTTRRVAELSVDQTADLFDVAARRIERLASQFTRWGLPWYARPENLQHLRRWADDDEGYHEWRVAVQPCPIDADAPEPHAFQLDQHGALPLVGGSFMADELVPAFARYVAMMGPQIAGALVATLREAAHRVRITGEHVGDDPLLQHLAELAVEIMHVEDPRDDL